MQVDFSYIPAVFFSSRCLHNTLRDLFLSFLFFFFLAGIAHVPISGHVDRFMTWR